MGNAYISVRIPEETKEALEKLSKIVDVNISDIVRDVVLPIAEIAKKIDVIETTEKLEKIVIQSIISLPEFQELLQKLTEFLETRVRYVGFCNERREEYSVLYDSYTISKDDKWFPARIEEVEECSDGTCWIERIVIKPIATLKELVEFLEEAKETVGQQLEAKISEVKEAIRELLR